MHMAAHEEAATIMRPMLMVHASHLGLLTQVSQLATSSEYPRANPMLDEWIKLARALVDVITTS